MGQKPGEIQFVIQRACIGDLMGSLKIGADYKLAAFTQGFLHVKPERLHELILVIQHREVIASGQLFFTPERAGR